MSAIDTSQSSIENYFINSYGAISNAEKASGVPLETIERRTNLIISLSYLFGLNHNQFHVRNWFPVLPTTILEHPCRLEFDEKGLPKLVNWEQQIEKDPEQFNTKESRIIYIKELHQKIWEIFHTFESIISEFTTTALSKETPIRDLKSRALRVLTLEKERDSLIFGWNSTLRFFGLSKIEASSTGFFNTLFTTAHDLIHAYIGWTPELPEFLDITYQDIGDLNYKFPSIDLNTFLCSKTIPYSRHQIFYKGTQREVQVIGKLHQLSIDEPAIHQNLKTIMYYFIRDSQDTLGYLSVKHMIPHTGTNFLSVDNFCPCSRSREETTGAMPIHEMLTQIAVEIFSAEKNLKHMSLLTAHNDGFVLAAGGFGGLPKIMEEITEVRKGGMIYPPFRDLHKECSGSPYLIKNDEPGALTKFVRLENEHLVPAMVNFRMDGIPITWEDKIFGNPMLGTPMDVQFS